MHEYANLVNSNVVWNWKKDITGGKFITDTERKKLEIQQLIED